MREATLTRAAETVGFDNLWSRLSLLRANFWRQPIAHCLALPALLFASTSMCLDNNNPNYIQGLENASRSGAELFGRLLGGSVLGAATQTLLQDLLRVVTNTADRNAYYVLATALACPPAVYLGSGSLDMTEADRIAIASASALPGAIVAAVTNYCHNRQSPSTQATNPSLELRLQEEIQEQPRI